MKAGLVRPGRHSLKGIQAQSVSLHENEIRVALKSAGRSGTWTLRLQGPIALEVFGLVGKALEDFSVLDKGSYRELRIDRKSGKAVFRCEYLEGEILPS